jgi:hypothetical protein
MMLTVGTLVGLMAVIAVMLECIGAASALWAIAFWIFSHAGPRHAASFAHRIYGSHLLNRAPFQAICPRKFQKSRLKCRGLRQPYSSRL